MHLLPPLALALIVAASTDLHAGEAPRELNSLERVQDAKVGLAYEKPGADWSKYKTIELKPLSIPQTVRNTAPAGQTARFGESYVLSDSDVATIQKAYDKATKDELAKGGFTFVDTPQADTLIVVPQIIDIKLNAPIQNTRLGYGGRSATFSKGGGSMAIAAALADGATGEVIAEAADRKYPADIWGINNSVTNLGEARQAFASWAALLRNRLTEKRGVTN